MHNTLSKQQAGEVRVHFGMNRGLMVNELSPRQRVEVRNWFHRKVAEMTEQDNVLAAAVAAYEAK